MWKHVKLNLRMLLLGFCKGFWNIFCNMGANGEKVGEEGDLRGSVFNQGINCIWDERFCEFEKTAGEVVELIFGFGCNSVSKRSHFIV